MRSIRDRKFQFTVLGVDNSHVFGVASVCFMLCVGRTHDRPDHVGFKRVVTGTRVALVYVQCDPRGCTFHRFQLIKAKRTVAHSTLDRSPSVQQVGTYRDDHDGDDVLDDEGEDRVVGPSVVEGPVLDAEVEFVDALSQRDAVSSQLLDHEEGCREEEGQDPYQEQDEDGAEELQTLFGRVDDDLMESKEIGCCAVHLRLILCHHYVSGGVCVGE